MTKFMKINNLYISKLIDFIHKEELLCKQKEICEITKNIFIECIHEIIDSAKINDFMNNALQNFILNTIYNSVVDINAIENYSHPDVIPPKTKKNKDVKDDTGLVIPSIEYEFLNTIYKISEMSNPIELTLMGNFGTKHRKICTSIQKNPYK